jgi:hypothetical protein
MPVVLNLLAYAETLEQGGFSREQARAGTHYVDCQYPHPANRRHGVAV